MSQLVQAKVFRVAGLAILSAALLLSPHLAFAQTSTPSEKAVVARIDFASAQLPPATVEVDLSQEIFSDLFGLGDAAIAGVIQALTEANAAHSSPATEMAADQLAAARQLIELAEEVVTEVHVRVYENQAEGDNIAAELTSKFESQLASGHWDNVVKVRDGNDSAQISFLRVEGSVLGVFAIVADGRDVVLVNVVCDISPENITNLTAAATKIGLANGLRQAIEHELRHHVQNRQQE